jgi:hypothetical protein
LKINKSNKPKGFLCPFFWPATLAVMYCIHALFWVISMAKNNGNITIITISDELFGPFNK